MVVIHLVTDQDCDDTVQIINILFNNWKVQLPYAKKIN